MQRILILGRGGAGKSTLARRLGALTGFAVIELDQLFWQPGLVATPRDRWIDIQHELIQSETWIIDGDLGPYDVLEPRLELADTVIVLDFSLPRCAWRSNRNTQAPDAGSHARIPRAAQALLAAIATGEAGCG